MGRFKNNSLNEYKIERDFITDMKKREEKKISYTQMDAIVEGYAQPDVEVKFEIEGADPVIVKVKRSLSFEDKAYFSGMIRRVVFCKDAETGEVDYRSSNEEIAFRFGICKYCTNLKMDDVNRTYWFYMNDSIFDRIKNAIPVGLYNELLAIADNEINYRCEEMLASNRKEVEAVLAAAQEQNRQMELITQEFGSLDMNGLIKTMGNLSEVDDATRVNAILDFQEKEKG